MAWADVAPPGPPERTRPAAGWGPTGKGLARMALSRAQAHCAGGQGAWGALCDPMLSPSPPGDREARRCRAPCWSGPGLGLLQRPLPWAPSSTALASVPWAVASPGAPAPPGMAPRCPGSWGPHRGFPPPAQGGAPLPSPWAAWPSGGGLCAEAEEQACVRVRVCVCVRVRACVRLRLGPGPRAVFPSQFPSHGGVGV